MPKMIPAQLRHSPGCGSCFIVPPNILKAYARDATLDPGTRGKLQDTFVETMRLRALRDAQRVATLAGKLSTLAVAPTGEAEQQLFDCRHFQSLPGRPIPIPPGPADAAAKAVFDTTAKVAEFYRTVLGRNSIDDQGLDLVSSIRYRNHYDNAFWNGSQMVYGDGDGTLFIDFWKSPDVIGHELTHGVTQYESGLRYDGESGALNESISDVFGAAFNQWLGKRDVTGADGWLIGAGIMGPRATGAGRTCLRDMLQPGAAHCLSPQPESYAQFDPTGDVHENSGIPNKAFALFAQMVGGNVWERAIKVWYDACTDRRLPSTATFTDFALLTIEAAAKQGLDAEAKQAWTEVKVPLAIA